MTRIDFRPMGGRSGYVWVYGTAAVAVAIMIYFAVTDFDPLGAALTLLLIGSFTLVIVRSKQWLEVTADDVALVQRRSFKTVRVGLKDAREVFLRGNGGGTAQFVAKDDSGTAVASLLVNSQYGQGYQGEGVLATLLEGVERNQTTTARESAQILRRQIEHARAGGSVADAPLAKFDRDWTSVSGLARGRSRPKN